MVTSLADRADSSISGRECQPPARAPACLQWAWFDDSDAPRQEGWDAMSCLKGKKKAKNKPGNFRCKKCGAIDKKKKKLCKPKKIKEDD
jgi:hypothetical protein